MAQIKWKGDIENRRIELKEAGMGPTAIANILSKEFNMPITIDMVNGRNKTLMKNKIGIFSKKQKNIEINNKNEDNLEFFTEEDCAESERFLYSGEIKNQLNSIYNLLNDGKSKKILSISDLHSPYMDIRKIDKVIRDNLDCEYCIINGDLLDMESMSSFDKMTEIDITKEFEQVNKLLLVLNKQFKKTIIVGGNHDYTRFARYIMKNIKPSLRSFAFDRLNPLKYITEKYENIEVINHNTLEIGDVIFKHPNKYCSGEMKTIVNEYYNMCANREDLPNPNFRSIIIGHTHMAGEYYYNGVKLIEQGCLCHKMDYRFLEPTKKSWTSGYAIINIDENYKVDLNKTKFIYLEN